MYRILIFTQGVQLPHPRNGYRPWNVAEKNIFPLLALHRTKCTCFRISETWRKHATPCFRYVCVCGNVKIQVYVIPSRFRNGNVQKVVRFRCIRSNGNVSNRHETANGNTGYPSCFRMGFTCFCDVSVYGFLEFRPVLVRAPGPRKNSL